MTKRKSTIVIVDDERASAIKREIKCYLREIGCDRMFDIASFSKIKEAKEFIVEEIRNIKILIFDSAFDKDERAGCQLYLELIMKYGFLRSFSIFFTAFPETVRQELSIGLLDKTLYPSHILEKSVAHGEEDLKAAFLSVLQGNRDAAQG